VQPGWGNVTPFAITSADSVEPPPLWGSGSLYGATTEADFLASPQYLSALNTVKATGCNGCGQTLDELNLSAFWADTNGNAQFGSTATPPGHWVAITDTVATSAGLSLLQTARLGAVVGASLADAGIVAWDVKNDNDFWRPDTAIHATGLGGGNDPTWRPLWPDPLFQSYISGHSTFSMAAAATLADFFGTDNISFCSTADPNAHDATNQAFAETRCFTSFAAAADEAGDSRIIGGIHFPFDNSEGLATGEAIADQVVANAFAAVPRAVFNGSTGDRGDGPRGDMSAQSLRGQKPFYHDLKKKPQSSRIVRCARTRPARRARLISAARVPSSYPPIRCRGSGTRASSLCDRRQRRASPDAPRSIKAPPHGRRCRNARSGFLLSRASSPAVSRAFRSQTMLPHSRPLQSKIWMAAPVPSINHVRHLGRNGDAGNGEER
jgi:membrane-associated phospholipid phosphatase